MYKFSFLFLTIICISFFSFSANIYANTINVFLNPSSDTIISDGTDIDIVVDSKGEEFFGMSIRLSHSDSIKYTGFKKGDIVGCDITESHSTLNEHIFFCFIFNDPYVGDDGIFGTLTFQALSKGTAEINIETIDAKPLNATFSGGDYTVLPDFSFFNGLNIVLGFVFLLSLVILILFIQKNRKEKNT